MPTDLFAAAATTAGGKNDMVRRASTTPLRRAGTVVHQPMHRFRLDAPEDCVGPLLSLLVRDLSEWPAEARAVLEQALARRYFVRVIAAGS